MQADQPKTPPDRLFCPVPKGVLPSGVVAAHVPEDNLILVDEDVWRLRGPETTRALFRMQERWLALV
jgi:hypothetical protein